MKYKNYFLSILFIMVQQLKLKKIIPFLLLFSIGYTGHSQQKNSTRSVAEFKSQITAIYSQEKSLSPSQQSIEVKAGKKVNIKIQSKNTNKTGDVFVGKVANSKGSHVFFQFYNEELEGKVIIPEEDEAYIYTSNGGIVSVTKKDIHETICTELQKAENVPSASTTTLAPPPGSTAYSLQSLPGATAVVLLDFDGHNTAGSWWGNVIAEPANVTESQITNAWQIVSEDFRPFQLNITTNEAVYQAAPLNRRMRVICTPTNTIAPGTGGIAYVGVFTYGGDLAPCWVFNIAGDGKIMGETASHEIGHTMGLLHDGREIPGHGHEEYYWGHGNWAPIMGVSFYGSVTQWSKGQYQYANNFEDDIEKIASSANGFGFRQNTYQSISTAKPMIITNGQISAQQNNGVIRNDLSRDFYTFTTLGGTLNLEVTPANVHPNLDVSIHLLNSTGGSIASSNPAGLNPAFLNIQLSAGTYYLSVMGVGESYGFSDGYTAFGSVGEYSILGTLSSDTDNPILCNPYIKQLSNGSIQLSVTYPVQKAMVEVFARKNDLQHLATNITSSVVVNANGTYTYSYIMPASYYVTGDKIQARFYSYSAGGPGEFTPGPAEGVWAEPFLYNVTTCDDISNPPTSSCNDVIQQLGNGDVKFSVSFPIQQAYVEVFATRNGQQNVAVNIVGTQEANANGSFSYSYVVPAAVYNSGDQIRARFYSYASGSAGVFTPGPTSATWSDIFTYNVTTCQTCNDVYEPNETMYEAKNIPLNVTIQAQVNTATDSDYYKITTTSAQPNIYIVLQNLVVDYDLYLFDSEGHYIAGSWIGGNSNEYISYSTTNAGTYYIRVIGWNGAFNDQCYQLKVTTSGNSIARVGISVEVASTIDKSKTESIGGYIEVFPNPAHSGGELNVTMLDKYENGKRLFRILNLTGHVISEQNVLMSSGNTVLDLSAVQPGLYVLDGGGNYKKKLLVE